MAKTIYGGASGVAAAEKTNSSYSTWGRVDASCSVSGNKLTVNFYVQTSGYPYMRVYLSVSNGADYDTGYHRDGTSSKVYPRGNGTSATWSCTLDDSWSNIVVQAGIGVSTSTISWGTAVTLQRAISYEYIPNINAYYPGTSEEKNPSGGNGNYYFNEYIAGKKYANLLNEQSIYMSPGTECAVELIKPLNEGSEFDYMTKQVGNNIEYLSQENGRFNFKVNGETTIHIYSKWISRPLILNPNGGFINNSTNKQTLIPNLVHNSENWYNISGYIPKRVGYKFLGFFDDKDNKIYDENGVAVEDSWLWTNDGTYKAKLIDSSIESVELHAKWKIQNVAYVKDIDNKWKLSTIFIKDNNNEWKPAIMYIKTETEDGWKQSITK